MTETYAMVPKSVDVIVIGGGLTGLTTAYYLKKYGNSVLVIEKNEKPGGVIQTVEKNGFIFEKGPNTGALGTEEAVELFDDLKELCTVEKADPEAERRLIWKGSKWEELPSGLVDAIKTPLFTGKDKVRILGEPFRKRGSDPLENIAEMVRRRLGESYLEYAVDPFLSGVYAGDPEYLVTKYALPKLYRLEQEYGSFVRGSIQKRKEPQTMIQKRADRSVFTMEGGLKNLIDALVTKIGSENILTHIQQAEVHQNGDGYKFYGKQNGQLIEVNCHQVVSATNAKAIPELFPFIPNDYTRHIDNLIYARLSQVILGFKKWDGVNIKAFGGLVPSKEKRDILGALFTSSFFSRRAPEGGALISVFMGGMQRPDLNDLSEPELLEVMYAEVSDMLQVDARKADLCEVFRYPMAIPQYGASTKERLEAITSIEHEFKGVVLAGNIRDGIGMADRIRQGRLVADQLAGMA